jgi:serine/threonine protein kinase
LRDLRHPNVVMFLGLFHDDRGEMWIVTEFLSHGSLRHMLQRVGARVTSSALLLMAKDAAAGMKYLSQNHILHRDLAARNLLVKGEDKRFVVKVADFGLSRVKSMTKTMSRIGTVQWVAPEVLREERYCFAARDHQLLTNRGFMFLDEVLEHVDYDERAHAVRDWRGLQLASYDSARGTLVYEQPEALVVNAASDVPDLVQFTHATETCRWTDAALARAGAADLFERERRSGVSVVVTPNHHMFVRNDDDGDDRPFHKVSAHELLRSQVDAIRLLARAEAGFAGAKVESLPLLELYGFWCGTGSRDGSGHVRFEAADVSFAEERLRLLGVASASHAGDRHCSTVVVKEPRIVELFVRAADRLAPWVWQLERDGARSVLTGLRAAADGMATPSAEFRDELVRLALHAGYAAHFVQQRAMWRVCVGDNDDDDGGEPVLRASVDAVGKVGGAELSQRYAGDMTWCATMPSGFIVTRRAHRDAVSGAVVRASQPTIQGNSTKSDVWSFGVVLWEMFEFGKVPYPGMSNRDAMQYVLTGSRLPKPDACPAELYRVMLDCWRADAQQRPSFQQIYDALVQALLRDTRPTVFALNVADGNVRAEPTSAVEARNDDEAYYADEFGVQISRPVRAEVTNDLGYVESPTVDARPDGTALNRHASDAFRSYAFAAMYGSSQQQSYDSESGDATAGASNSMFGLSTGMPSIFTIDPSLLTTRELTNKMDVPDRDTSASASNGPLIDFIRDDDADDDDGDDDDDNNTNGDYGSDIYDNYGQ